MSIILQEEKMASGKQIFTVFTCKIALLVKNKYSPEIE